jgi:hypothetical protein
MEPVKFWLNFITSLAVGMVVSSNSGANDFQRHDFTDDECDNGQFRHLSGQQGFAHQSPDKDGELLGGIIGAGLAVGGMYLSYRSLEQDPTSQWWKSSVIVCGAGIGAVTAVLPEWSSLTQSPRAEWRLYRKAFLGAARGAAFGAVTTLVGRRFAQKGTSSFGMQTRNLVLAGITTTMGACLGQEVSLHSANHMNVLFAEDV